jgi:type II secretory pathway pseudopilin PulG
MPRSGAILIEALIAIALVAAVLPVALSAVSSGVQAAEQARQRQVATRIAQSRLSRMLADDSWLTSPASGDCDPAVDGEDAVGMHWTLAVAAWRDPTVRSIRLEVAWQRSGRSDAVAVASLAAPSGGVAP